MGETKRLVFLGAGDAFLEIYDLIQDINDYYQDIHYEVIAILDDDENKQGTIMEGVKVVGKLSAARDFPDDVSFVFGIGSRFTRKKRREIIESLGISRERFVTLVHPSAKVYRSTNIGHGCIIHTGAVVGAVSKLKDFVIVTYNSVIGAHTVVEDFAMIASSVTVLNHVHIAEGAFLGVGVCVADGVKIGKYAVIGMTSFVARNVKHGELVLGVPSSRHLQADDFF